MRAATGSQCRPLTTNTKPGVVCGAGFRPVCGFAPANGSREAAAENTQCFHYVCQSAGAQRQQRKNLVHFEINTCVPIFLKVKSKLGVLPPTRGPLSSSWPRSSHCVAGSDNLNCAVFRMKSVCRDIIGTTAICGRFH